MMKNVSDDVMNVIYDFLPFETILTLRLVSHLHKTIVDSTFWLGRPFVLPRHHYHDIDIVEEEESPNIQALSTFLASATIRHCCCHHSRIFDDCSIFENESIFSQIREFSVDDAEYNKELPDWVVSRIKTLYCPHFFMSPSVLFQQVHVNLRSLHMETRLDVGTLTSICSYFNFDNLEVFTLNLCSLNKKTASDTTTDVSTLDLNGFGMRKLKFLSLCQSHAPQGVLSNNHENENQKPVTILLDTDNFPNLEDLSVSGGSNFMFLNAPNVGQIGLSIPDPLHGSRGQRLLEAHGHMTLAEGLDALTMGQIGLSVLEAHGHMTLAEGLDPQSVTVDLLNGWENIRFRMDTLCTLRLNNVDGDFHVLSDMPSLKTLHLERCQSIMTISDCPNLEDLTLNCCLNVSKITDMPKLTRVELSDIQQLATFTRVPNVSSLSVFISAAIRNMTCAMPVFCLSEMLSLSSLAFDTYFSAENIIKWSVPLGQSPLNLQKVDITHYDFDFKRDSIVASIPSLRSLTMESCRHFDFKYLEDAKNLKELCLVRIDDGFDDGFIQKLPVLQYLKKLVVVECMFFEEMPSMPELVDLKLVALSPVFTMLPQELPKLLFLEIDSLSMITINAMENLISLQTAGNCNDDYARLLYCRKLRNLALSCGDNVTNLQVFFLSLKDTLEKLQVSIYEHAMPSIRVLSGFTRLHSLSLKFVIITNIQKLPELVEFEYIMRQDTSRRSLLCLADLPKLEICKIEKEAWHNGYLKPVFTQKNLRGIFGKLYL